MEDLTKSIKDGKNDWKKMVKANNDPGILGDAPGQYAELSAAGKTGIGAAQVRDDTGPHKQARTENPDGYVSSNARDTQRVFTQEAANRILALTNKLYTQEDIVKNRMSIYSNSIDKSYGELLDRLSSIEIDDLKYSGNSFVKPTREFILETLPRVKQLHDSLWGSGSNGGIVAQLNNQIKTSITSVMGTTEIHSAFVYVPDFKNVEYPAGEGTVKVATDKAENTLNSYSAWETYILEHKNHLVYFLYEFIKANNAIETEKNSLASKLQESIDNFTEAQRGMNIQQSVTGVGTIQNCKYKGKTISFEKTNASETLRKFVKLLAAAGTESGGREISLNAILKLFESFNKTIAELQGVIALLRSLSEILPVAQEKQNEIGRKLSAAHEIVIVGDSAVIELDKLNLPPAIKQNLVASTKEVIDEFSDKTKTIDDKTTDGDGDKTDTDGGDSAPVPVKESRTGHGPGKIFDPSAQHTTLSEEKSPIDSVNRKHKKLNESWKTYASKGIKNNETPDKFNILMG